MSFASTLQRIESSVVFNSFKQQYPDAELCAGFFILDFLSNDDKHSLDYKTDEKIFTFDIIGDDVIMKEDKLINDSKFPELKRIEPSVGVEIDELKGIAGTQALDNGIHAKFHKIIAVLQVTELNGEDKQVWNLTCLLDNLIILHILIDAFSGKVIKFERKSMMDLVKKK